MSGICPVVFTVLSVYSRHVSSASFVFNVFACIVGTQLHRSVDDLYLNGADTSVLL